ncbi:double zinc ribbon domain-containing protein [Natronobacterium gregoryi]|uniref:CopG family transcriptional regulator n=2 Tax=Natronobacterium gregoryi TaxID=44930 RepID=L0AKI8_NATGS|nr:zinc ribbon domain-containing protein [Natronobacterium gregoryi]AFZ73672.1 hypothetical protein Natgr_2508 [Natronobacterium gregoryi SP2]ELY67865.1 CopG family transcriptional regulator [Natronobacterium gregoryi SP2]PLK19603.1 ribbon-helix-helix protein, CopG family [Natronobacterium gregoryi SP2]SFJ00709.1 Ribbon-helix-helix protein, copG family [Natronobacterium gregoryi]
MSKITFRADDDLVEALESLELSKSEAMRQALRAYIDERPERKMGGSSTAVDDVVRERVDELIEKRLREERRRGHAPADDGPRSRGAVRAEQPQDVTVSISLEGESLRTDTPDSVSERTRETNADRERRGEDRARRGQPEGTTCGQCGEHVADDHVYCPNCGEKASRRLFCDCGDELRSDWAFCPSCGRRTPSADVLEPDVQRD